MDRPQSTPPAAGLRRPRRLFAPLGLAFGIYGAELVTLYTVGAYAQLRLGIPGLIITEFLLLFFPLLSLLAFRLAPLSVFRLHKTRLRYYFGGILLWMGIYGIDIGLVSLLSLIDPGLSETGQAMGELFGGMGFFPAVAIVALLPAVCEELLMRGFLQTGLESRLRPGWAVLICGVLFGLLHFDPSRMAVTALLGCGLAYTAYRARSIFPAMLVHFLNNLFSVVSVYALKWVSTAGSGLELEQYYEQAGSAFTTAAGVIVVVVYAALGCGLAIAGVAVLRK